MPGAVSHLESGQREREGERGEREEEETERQRDEDVEEGERKTRRLMVRSLLEGRMRPSQHVSVFVCPGLAAPHRAEKQTVEEKGTNSKERYGGRHTKIAIVHLLLCTFGR